MAKREYKDVIKDLKSFASENEQLDSEEKEKLLAYINEVVDVGKKDMKDVAYFLLFLLIMLIGAIAMWIISDIRNDDLENDIKVKKEMIQDYEKIIRFENDSAHTFVYQTKNGTPITYQELMDENLELLNKNSKLKMDLTKKDEEIRTKNVYLDLARKNYGIRFIEKRNYYSIEAPKVDSAMMLLELYRDKIKYNAKDKSWSVSR